MAVATRKSAFSPEEKQAWKEERMQEQKQLLEQAVANLASSETWTNWVKYGRSNLRKYSFNNAMLIFLQKADARLVRGKKQWLAKKVNVNEDAKALRILAPCVVTVKDENGRVLYDGNGQPMKKVAFYKLVNVYDVSETDAPDVSSPYVTLDGDEHINKLDRLEQWGRELGVSITYEDIEQDGYYDERKMSVVVKKSLSGNALVRTLLHELFHVYGNVNYSDYTREEAEVMVESATVMALGMLDFDVSQSSVPYIQSWGGDLKVLDKFARLIEEMVKTATNKIGVV